MKRRISLREWELCGGVSLRLEERDALLKTFPSLSISPTPGKKDAYDLRPGSHVGVARFGDLEVEVRPKIQTDRLLFLLSYIADPKHWRTATVGYREQDDAVEAVATALVDHLKNALARGLLQGYRHVQEADLTIRGRLHLCEQIRKRYGVAIPAEIEFDDYSTDILENQLLLAAVHRLRRIGVRQEGTARDLAHAEHLFHGVSLVEFHPHHVPAVRYDRLNEHYQASTELARLILASSGMDLGEGPVPGLSFVVDMNDVFEDFVVVALREALGVSSTTLVQGKRSPARLWLDSDDRIVLKPDLSWWEGRQCLFVGDVKYKILFDPDRAGADFYQLLSYLIGSRLSTGYLIYPARVLESSRYRVRNADKTLELRCLDVTGTPGEILAGVSHLANDVKILADGARNARLVA